MKKNPDYKGKWTAPYIDNPAYKGIWAPRKIANPDYYEDKTPANFEPMGAIGFEIWTMQSDILFDNIYIGHSVADANALRAETYDLKRPAEDAEDEATKPKSSEHPKSPSDLSFMDDPVTFVREKAELFFTIAKNDPIEAFRFVPEAMYTAIALGAVVLLGLGGALFGGSSKAPSKEDMKKTGQKAKNAVADAKDQAVNAAASATETAKVEATKRTTRSSAAAENE